ncbi:LysR family transcriptional regulator [Mesorhizobium sp. NBSH29]|uniref:LysR family transcriptional regulator n=1 Tax=Mesorhizobium sp. NBSH29 TaxID=2654249 RepID=UPI001896536C|nr:LysR family transcriptional regulator [Mesorhizobium sp. NBSH29]QPC88034.1 LysR family transcriptional regulator [Mesorhizobium sp. NBSH29]
MDRLDELTIFLAIIDSGSLVAAARRLRRSPPQVTRALNELEARAGARLVARTTRRLSATEAGMALAEKARQVLIDYEGALAGDSSTPLSGLVRVTAPVQFGRRYIAPLISTFLDAYPSIQVDLVLHDRNLDLMEERIDVAVRIGPLPDSSLRVRTVGMLSHIVVASPDYLAARGIPQRPADLAHHEIIFNSLQGGPREWRFAGKKSVRLTPRLLVNDVESQLIAARAGRGIAGVLSYQAADDIAAGTLATVLDDFTPPPYPVQLVSSGDPLMPRKVRAFIDHAAEALRRLPIIHPDDQPLPG